MNLSPPKRKSNKISKCINSLSFVDNAYYSKFKEIFDCGICNCTIKNPVMCNVCERTYCDDCLTSWVENIDKCPLGNHNVKKTCINKTLSRLFDKLTVRCKNNCEVSLLEYDSHKVECDMENSIYIECNACDKLAPKSLVKYKHIESAKNRNKAFKLEEDILKNGLKVQGNQLIWFGKMISLSNKQGEINKTIRSLENKITTKENNLKILKMLEQKYLSGDSLETLKENLEKAKEEKVLVETEITSVLNFTEFIRNLENIESAKSKVALEAKETTKKILKETEQVLTINDGFTVYCITTFSSNGSNYIVTGNKENDIVVWNAENCKIYHRFQGVFSHTGSVYCLVAFKLQTSNDHLIASGSDDNTIKLWCLEHRKHLFTLKSHSQAVICLNTILIDGHSYLISGSDDKSIKIWNPEDGNLITTLSGHLKWISCLESMYFKDKTVIVSGSGDAQIKVWNPLKPHNEALERVLCKHESFVNCFAQIEKGGKKLLVSGGSDYVINVWDIQSGTIQSSFKVSKSYINSLCTICVNNETVLVVGSADSKIKFIDIENGHVIATLKGHKSYINCLSTVQVRYNEKEQTAIISLSRDNTIKFWL